MRKYVALLCVLLMLSGCGKGEDPFRVDTVVRIPVDPTDASAAAETTEPENFGMSLEDKVAAVIGAAVPEEQLSEENTVPSATEEKPHPTESGATEPQVTGTMPSIPVATEPLFDAEQLAGAILTEMNRRRTDAGLEELTMEDELCRFAEIRAGEALRLWSHSRPDGRDFRTVLSDNGWSFQTAADYLFHGNGNADAGVVVSKWMNTESRDNILGEAFVRVGVGICIRDGVTCVAVLMVG